MKFQKRIRMQMLLVGVGAALLMAGSTRAQQEIDPTYFDVNPGTPTSQTAAPQVVKHQEVARNREQSESPLAVASADESTLEASVARMTIVDVGVVLILAGGIFSIAMYAMVATRRERNIRSSSVSASYTPVSAATAQ